MVQQVSATIDPFFLCCMINHLCWHAFEGLEIQVGFGYISDRACWYSHLLSYLTSSVACSWLIFLRTNQTTNRDNVSKSPSGFRSSIDWLSLGCGACTIYSLTNNRWERPLIVTVGTSIFSYRLNPRSWSAWMSNLSLHEIFALLLVKLSWRSIERKKIS